jgi:glycosyltransferase involved in cell wall biosynthesis
LHPSSDDPAIKHKVEYQDFLEKFLPRLYKITNIKCVISTHLYHAEDTDWGIVSNRIGVPYIVFHRENLYAAPITRKRVIDRYKQFDSFQGRHIIVHNEISRQTFIQSCYVKPKQISSLGCLRMDSYLKRVKENRKNANEGRKKVVFFPFVLNYYSPFGFSFFREVHVAFMRFAMLHPETDVIIKPKPKWYPYWRKDLQRSIEDSDIELQKISNLIIRTDLDAQELILAADVVSGLSSTVVVEAAIAGKPVIIPYFSELQDPVKDDYIFFKEEFDLFDIAESVDELTDLIVKRLEDQRIGKIIMDGRKAMFEKYISSLSGDATEKYIALIRQVVNGKTLS